jgi:predicted component of type VI protein secretion system
MVIFRLIGPVLPLMPQHAPPSGRGPQRPGETKVHQSIHSLNGYHLRPSSSPDCQLSTCATLAPDGCLSQRRRVVEGIMSSLQEAAGAMCAMGMPAEGEGAELEA